jgi:hypothetical protein
MTGTDVRVDSCAQMDNLNGSAVIFVRDEPKYSGRKQDRLEQRSGNILEVFRS